MEVDATEVSHEASNGADGKESVVAPAGSVNAQGSVSVAIHPLVLLNISEHWTRQQAQEGQPTQVVGALLGKQNGRNVEIFNTFELKMTFFNIDRTFFATRQDQFKQVFQDLELLGWYSTGGTPDPLDISVHKQISDFHESPLFLKLNPASRQDDLPVSVFESLIDIVAGKATMFFVEIPFTLATETSERIGVDHVTRLSSFPSSSTEGASESENAGPSLLADHLASQFSAIKMLHTRVKLIMDYVKAVDDGVLSANHEILREIKSLVNRLPLMEDLQFQSDLANQRNDVVLMTYLGSVTQGCNLLNQFVEKVNYLYDRPAMRRKMRGIVFL